MKRLLIATALVAVFSFPVFAESKTTSISSLSGQSSIASVEGGASCQDVYKAGVRIYGTFNSCDIHWLMSTGTSHTAKDAIQYASNTSSGAADRISRADDNFVMEWPCPSGTSDLILYYSVGTSCSSAPSLTVTVDDNL